MRDTEKVLIYENRFDFDSHDFVKEGNGSCVIKEGKLFMDDTVEQSGLTCWLNKSFEGDIYISYEAMTIEPEMAGNINFFFMAKTLEDGFILEEKHTGDYSEYHQTTKMYIFTFTGDFIRKNGNRNTGHSRVRKDPGFILLSEDLSTSSKLNTRYFFEIIKLGNTIECRINHQTIHKVNDNESYSSGSIGFRTWRTHLWIDNLKIYSINTKR